MYIHFYNIYIYNIKFAKKDPEILKIGIHSSNEDERRCFIADRFSERESSATFFFDVPFARDGTRGTAPGEKRNEREETTLMMIVTKWPDKYREAFDDLDRLSRLVMDPMALDRACHVVRESSTSLYAPGFCSATTWSSRDKSITMERRNNNTPSDRARWNEIVDEISIERDRDPRNQSEEWE